jgi:hypothetical protein
VKPVTMADVLDIAQYEKQRAALRPRYLEIKARRRSAVGEHMTLLWENRDTAWYQIEEMMRIERIVDEQAIRHEIDTYNDLVPGPGELKATMLLEFPEPGERDARLRALVGLEKHLGLLIDGRHPAAATFDTRQMSTEKLSSVQFVTFRLSDAARAALLAGASAEVVVTHAACAARAPLGAAVLEELKADLLAE